MLGVQDGNVDPIRCGVVDAEPPALLGRCLFTDGIVLEPPPPVVEDPGQSSPNPVPPWHGFPCLGLFFVCLGLALVQAFGHNLPRCVAARAGAGVAGAGVAATVAAIAATI